jgi:hypothetical protein
LRLVDLLNDRYVSKGQTFDFARKSAFFTLDVITDISFGQPLGCLENDTDMHQYIHMTEVQMPNVALTTVYPWLLDVMTSPVFRGLMPSAKDALGFGRLIG